MPKLLGTLHAAEHTLIALLPLWAMCDRWDIGGLSTNVHYQTGAPTIFVYDGHAGGVGITARGFASFEGWVEDTTALLRQCPCNSGCPSCVQSPKCGNLNEMLDKAGARRCWSGCSRLRARRVSISHGRFVLRMMESRRRRPRAVHGIDLRRRGALGRPLATRSGRRCTAATARCREDAREAGVLVGGDELGPTRDATTVRVRETETLVTDGPVRGAEGGARRLFPVRVRARSTRRSTGPPESLPPSTAQSRSGPSTSIPRSRSYEVRTPHLRRRGRLVGDAPRRSRRSCEPTSCRAGTRSSSELGDGRSERRAGRSSTTAATAKSASGSSTASGSSRTARSPRRRRCSAARSSSSCPTSTRRSASPRSSPSRGDRLDRDPTRISRRLMA